MDNGKKPQDEQELLENGYKKYCGDRIDVYFNKCLCVHSGNCLRGNPAVFKFGRKPWIITDAADAEEVARVIDTCPTGALKYIWKTEKP
ncbi:(4Fe-4S)-binding protein [Anaerotalea alkaliphila]|uniref:Divergent 4Fe-4S mono-cluster domain-containing protein n=1 Tax=Anaerotalea alkaliphila TaxID=2662126 RepID=A0A7X5HW08_9FIRM|nr:(4Fe-4S)-binding protein [Anaerotalea alkaliphila]NDL67481.1 hypothetical protein [Anaerotalea alkaliphila]